jgi:hypothetical protein
VHFCLTNFVKHLLEDVLVIIEEHFIIVYWIKRYLPSCFFGSNLVSEFTIFGDPLKSGLEMVFLRDLSPIIVGDGSLVAVL